ncbi:MAG: RdgB/HAM1 family non-canonical purine NTP pyrophosphatase [bacterium]|nr:RdgB/HAM1 family non-canonical purine NTP pyrophosphatase [bacterium]
MKLIFASHNPGKVNEMHDLLSGLSIDVLSAEQIGIMDDVEEDGLTLEENALKKARFVAQKSGQWSVADDTGLFIKALDGRPGIYSARWAGENSTDKEKYEKVLQKLESIPANQRQAYFESVIALVTSTGEELIFLGKIDGYISLTPRGKIRSKLPYDNIFIPEGFEMTFAEMSDEKKNSLSHRGKAFRQLKKYLESNI